jgi:protein O-mannosyl-transferase
MARNRSEGVLELTGAAGKRPPRNNKGRVSSSARSVANIQRTGSSRSIPNNLLTTLSVCTALIIFTIAVYAPVRHYEFINYDDPDYVTANPAIAQGITMQSLKWAFTTDHAGNWHPISWLSHMADVQLFGFNPGAHHLTSLFLHIANTLLLFGLFLSVTHDIGPSAFVAALFAVHPMHVQSVAWVSERKDVLSTLLAILTLWAHVLYSRTPADRGMSSC